jgi:hypothetical protein
MYLVFCMSTSRSNSLLVSIKISVIFFMTASMVWWSEFLTANPEVLGSIPGAARFSKWQWVWNGAHSAL